MVTIKLKDGSVKQIDKGATALDAAKAISEGLARASCAASVNGKLTDLRTQLNEDCNLSILTFNDDGGKQAFWHTTSHVLAQAVKNLYPTAKLAIGPAVSDGFYYDFDFDKPVTNDDLPKIEEEMKKIIKQDFVPTCFSLPKAEAISKVESSGEIYKSELINELPEGEVITFYRQGDFEDLCAGPHLMNLKTIKAIKLTSASGAYWRGSEKNKMLTRIYGVSFPKQSELDEHLHRIEEAKKRDHNKVGRELKMFTTSDWVGQGLPHLMPKGAKIVQLLQRFVEDEEERRGYVLTKTPFVAKPDLYKVSGHWDLYKDGMFVIGDEEKEGDVFALRPMTCPFQFVVYNAEQHSYRDLPVRYGETSTLFRNESSGEMHGLIRLRQFTLSEGHIICTKEQLEEEFKAVIDIIKFMMETIGIQGDIQYRFSKWDAENKDKYVGDAKLWEETQDAMREMLINMGLDFYEADGEAAFYGPKLDVQMKNVHGKEDTIITAQIDFSLAERFKMTYIEKDGTKQHPVVIHRSSIGCYERTLAMLIEKYNGSFPTWLSPIQAIVLPISDRYNDYAENVVKKLKDAGIRVQGDYRSEKIGFKIREARNERVPYILVTGEKESENGTVALRSRDGDEGETAITSVIERIIKETNERTLNVDL